MTLVINIIGGPGSGKSTSSAGLYYQMKLAKKNVELVNEWVKKWAWEGKKINEYDQVYISAKQIKSESLLYGKVDYIITDSPVILGAIYEDYYNQTNNINNWIQYHLNTASANNIKHKYYYLNRTKEYNPNGRWQTEEEAVKIDLAIKKYLDTNSIDYDIINIGDEFKVDNIINKLRMEKLYV
jgi:adenylate kinase family enzyme